MRFKDKVAIITGAAQGIGFAAAHRLATEGAHVIVADASLDKGAAAAESLRRSKLSAAFIKTDVSVPGDITAMVDSVDRSHGKIDVLVNNAGITNTTHFLNVTEEEFDRVIDVNLKSVLLCSQAVARKMIANETKGAIVNLTSIAATLASPVQAVYASSKGGIVALTKVIAMSLAEYGIRANAVGPGTILTEMARGVVMGDEETRRKTLARIPLQRFGEAEEIAGVISFLASDDASYITGQTIYADGGRLALNFTVPVKS